MAEFRWTKQRERAATFVAEDRLSNRRIAEKLGISERTLDYWIRDPAFKARVADRVATFAERVKTHGIADRIRRLSSLGERWLALQQIVAERAAEYAPTPDAADDAHPYVPGASTGLLVRQ